MKDMPEMMQKCMKMMQEFGFKDMCDPNSMEEMMNKMQQRNKHTEDIAKYSTPELRNLFEDWLIQLEEEIISFAGNNNKVTPDEVAAQFKISKESAEFILCKLTEAGKI